MTFIDKIKIKAKQNVKTIILPEATDIRVLKATHNILAQGFANIVLIGDNEIINKTAKENNLDVSKAKIISPKSSEQYNDFVNAFFELRKHKGMTIEKAKELILEPIYFGMMMLKLGYADGLVSGAIHSTADTLRPALQILKTAPNVNLVSTFFVMEVPDCEYGEDGVFVFADCGLNQNPSSEELAEIAIVSSKSFEQLIEESPKVLPKVAMLSYSTYGSAKSESVEKVANATRIAKEKAPNLIIDGELQLDAAIIPEVAKLKAPDSCLKGQANTLIFPDLNAGNIGYKLVQRLAKAEAYGPLCQGIAKPVNDLSRGCSSEDIEGVVALTAVQAQNNI